MIVVTLSVSVLPVLAVSALHSEGTIDGLLPLVGTGLAISFAITMAGSALWKAIPGSGDMLFGDLIVWGFVRRWRVDRRMSNAAGLLGVRGGRAAGDLSQERRAELLEALGNSLEARDPYTHGHSRRVARHSTMIAGRLGLSREEVARIRTAAAIHDVGKVDTPKAVLGKPGRLNDEEFEAIKRHPVDGARMAAALGDPKLTEMVLHHHERLDGGGYPQGLSGDEIPLGARIIAVADTFDAITSARPYRPAKAHKAALEVLRAESGTQLDSAAVEAFHGYYSGLRPVAIWSVLVNVPQRLFNGLFDGIGSGVVSASKMAAATTASVIAGTAAAHAVATAEHPSGEGDRGQAESMAFVPRSDVVLTFAAPRSHRRDAPKKAAKPPSGLSGGGSALKGPRGAGSSRRTEARTPAGIVGGGVRDVGGPGGSPGAGDLAPDRGPVRTTGRLPSATDDGPRKPGAVRDTGADQVEPTAAATESGKPTDGKGRPAEHPSSDKGSSNDSPSPPADGTDPDEDAPTTPLPEGGSSGGGPSSDGGSRGGGPPASPDESNDAP